MSRDIRIESLPLDENGQPVLETSRGVPGKVKLINDKGQVSEVDGLRVAAKTETRSIKVKSSHVGKIVDICEGSKLIISVTDAPNGQQCPSSLIVGSVVFLKDQVYELNYSKDPIKGWTIRDRSDVKNPNAKSSCYPEGINDQKELIELLLEQSATHECPFVRYHIEYPAEVQHKLDMEQLVAREEALAERRKAVEQQLAKQAEVIEKKRKEISSKYKAIEKEDK